VLAHIKIIRPINLLLIILAMILIKYTLFQSFDVTLALTPITFSLLIFATVSIAAGGNIINDVYDVTIDAINKPNKVIVGKSISEKNAFNFYIVLTVLGVGSGFVLSNLIGKPGLAVVFILVAALLYWYATFIKSMLLIGNLLISVLVGFSLLILVLFDIFPALNEMEKPIQLLLSKTVFGYAIAGFFFNFIREVVKDIQDINGDKNGERTTLPIVLGISRTTTFVFALGVFSLFMILIFAYHNLYQHTFLLFYFIFLLGGSLLIFSIKAWNAKKPNDYKLLSVLLKISMLLGVCSIPLYAQIL
jgi:4-hydroxybenzoate polyprenyltransferase